MVMGYGCPYRREPLEWKNKCTIDSNRDRCPFCLLVGACTCTARLYTNRLMTQKKEDVMYCYERGFSSCYKIAPSGNPSKFE